MDTNRNTYRKLASGTEVWINEDGVVEFDIGQEYEGPTCSLCDALGHGYPGGGPCPLEERGYDDGFDDWERSRGVLDLDPQARPIAVDLEAEAAAAREVEAGERFARYCEANGLDEPRQECPDRFHPVGGIG